MFSESDDVASEGLGTSGLAAGGLFGLLSGVIGNEISTGPLGEGPGVGAGAGTGAGAGGGGRRDGGGGCCGGSGSLASIGGMH